MTYTYYHGQVYTVIDSHYVVKSDNSLERSRMSKHHLSIDIAHSIDMRDICLHRPVVDNNST